MSTPNKDSARDEARLGTCAAKQPVSGTSVVTKVSVKGFNGISTSFFFNGEETKRAS